MMTKGSRIAFASVLAFQLSTLHSLEATTLHFSGYDWEVKSGDGLGPGPNNWKTSNAWVDANGYLHLKITQVDGKWYSASVKMTQSLGFGTYQFWVIGAIDTLDKNVVLGMFNYPTADVGPDGTNEIDIEIARWGDATKPNLNYTVWPAEAGYSQTSHKVPFTLTGTYTTHRFKWQSDKVEFWSLHGHQPLGSLTNLFESWTFSPFNSTRYVPQDPIPLRVNLWLFHGNPPSNGQEVEVVIRSFTYAP